MGGEGKGGRGGRGEEGRGRRALEKGMVEIGERQRGRVSKEIEGAIMGLVRNLTLGKFPGIDKDDPNKIL